MKKIVSSILMISYIFSIFAFSSVNASSRWYIDMLLDFPYWVEEMAMNVEEINYIYFFEEDSQKLYDNYRIAENVLKNEVVNLYKNDVLDYYTMNWIIKNYNLFIYHTNKMFYYIQTKEVRYDNQLNKIILEHYELSRQYYNTVKHLISSK